MQQVTVITIVQQQNINIQFRYTACPVTQREPPFSYIVTAFPDP